jgi:hypothetical protein
MFLAGLKFALGLVTGLGLLAGFIVLTFICIELFALWRKKYRPRMWEPKARASRRAMPRFRERAVFNLPIVPTTGYQFQTNPNTLSGYMPVRDVLDRTRQPSQLRSANRRKISRSVCIAVFTRS